MKTFILSTAMLVLGLGNLHAGTTVEDALTSDTNYDLAGTFAPYDFAPTGDKNPFDWAFTTSDGHSYQLRGNAPDDNNVFGWKAVDITAPAPAWHMFQLHGDVDGDGSGKFDWVLVSSDTNSKAVYKLAGVSGSGTFEYSARLDVDYSLSGNTIQTGVIGGASSSSSSSTASQGGNVLTINAPEDLRGYTIKTNVADPSAYVTLRYIYTINCDGSFVVETVGTVNGNSQNETNTGSYITFDETPPAPYELTFYGTVEDFLPVGADKTIKVGDCTDQHPATNGQCGIDSYIESITQNSTCH